LRLVFNDLAKKQLNLNILNIKLNLNKLNKKIYLIDLLTAYVSCNFNTINSILITNIFLITIDNK